MCTKLATWSLVAVLVACGASSPATSCPVPSPRERARTGHDRPSEVEIYAGEVCIVPKVIDCAYGRYNGFKLALAISGRTGYAKLVGLKQLPSKLRARTPAREYIRARAARRPVDPKTRRCVEEAIARLRFAPFEQETFEHTYQIRLVIVSDSP
jgi:hypothetical protein